MEVELILDAQATLGEGPVWHARRQQLYWVDIDAGLVHVYDPAEGTDTAIDVGQMVGCMAPRRAGGLVLALHHGFALLNLKNGALTPLADPEAHLPDNRFNDGKCDPAGRFWAGTLSLSRTPQAAALYCLETDLTVRRVLEGVTTSNGIAFSLDGTRMYYIDTPTLRVDAFDYDLAAGTIGNRRTVIQFPEGVGRPDGMTIDEEGFLWIAHWDGGRVTHWDPHQGTLLDTIELPVARVTSCTFGGRNLDELYITTARVGRTPDQLAGEPHAGGLFLARPGVSGVEAHEFGG